MKSVLLSVRPEWVAKILNGEKTIEIRKKFPQDYAGWVYIYCTKDKQLTLRNERYILINGEKYHIDSPILNGKVVARFWCDKVEEIIYEKDELKQAWGDLLFGVKHFYHTRRMAFLELVKKSCLAKEEMHKYLKGKDGYAIHIANLEIFDKPKEISEFGRVVLEPRFFNGGEYYEEDKNFLTRAPQSWCYVEV